MRLTYRKFLLKLHDISTNFMFVWNSRNSLTGQLADFLSRFPQPRLTNIGRSVLFPWLFGPFLKAKNKIISCPKVICSFQPHNLPNLSENFFQKTHIFLFSTVFKPFYLKEIFYTMKILQMSVVFILPSFQKPLVNYLLQLLQFPCIVRKRLPVGSVADRFINHKKKNKTIRHEAWMCSR